MDMEWWSEMRGAEGGERSEGSGVSTKPILDDFQLLVIFKIFSIF